MPDDFDWSATNEDVVLPEQRATAVYVNNFGQAVIRQEAGFNDDEDTYVVIDHANIPQVIKALRDIADAPALRLDPKPEAAPASGKGDVVRLHDARGEHSKATE